MVWPEMSRRFNLTPDANHDIDEAVAWYDGQKPDLGGRFVRALRRRFDDILRNPEFFRPVGRRSIRKARLLHWPHSIFFRILPDEVRIISVWHGARDPRELNHRLR